MLQYVFLPLSIYIYEEGALYQMCHAIMYDNHNSMIIILEHHSSKPMMLLPYQAASWRQASEPYPLDRLYQVHVEILYHYPVSLIVSARVSIGSIIDTRAG